MTTTKPASIRPDLIQFVRFLRNVGMAPVFSRRMTELGREEWSFKAAAVYAFPRDGFFPDASEVLARKAVEQIAAAVGLRGINAVMRELQLLRGFTDQERTDFAPILEVARALHEAVNWTTAEYIADVPAVVGEQIQS